MAATSKYTMIFMIVLNLLVFVAGGALLIAAFMLKFSSGFLHLDVTTLFNKVTVNRVPLGTIADANTYMMMLAGAFVMFIAILGLCGAWHHIKGCLWAYVTLTIILIMLQAVVVALWIFMRHTTDEWFRGQMLSLLTSYEGPEATDEVSRGWNKLFMKAECCAVNDEYADGGSNNDFNEVPAAWWASRGMDNLPATCCQGVSDETIADYVDSDICTKPPKNFYTTGCYNTIKRIVNVYSLLTLIVIGVIFFVQVTAIVCACMLAKENKVGNFPKRRQDGFDHSKVFPLRPKQIRY